MDKLSFIAALVSALAWPAAAVLLGLIFRRSLNHVLTTAKRLKAPGVEIERDVEELQQKAAELPVSRPPTALPSTTGADLSWLSPGAASLREQVAAVADIAPQAAIALAWVTLSLASEHSFVKRLENGESAKRRFPIAHITVLRDAGIIDNDVASMLSQMRDVRNRVMHEVGGAAEIPVAEAKAFGEVAASLCDYLDSLIRR